MVDQQKQVHLDSAANVKSHNNDALMFDAFEIGDELSDGIYITDGNGIVLSVNKSYEDIVGISADEMIGHHISLVKDRVNTDEIVALMVIEQKRKLRLSKVIGDTNKLVLISGYPRFNDNNEIVSVLTVIRDLTELFEIKERLEKAEREKEQYLKELNQMKIGQSELPGIVGQSVEIHRIKELILNIAKTDASILITGETGCGKEVIAKGIHQNSNRAEMPYIKVNCVAIPDALLESELFGYEKGAFTGALNKTKPGMFELANGGTLLLDEIGDMPMNLQSKLLRVLQERELRRIGGTDNIKLDLRLIASTNKDLKMLIAENKFREDLYYRLNVVPIYVPPVREHKDDIPLLVEHFLALFNEKYKRNKTIDAKTMAVLEAYDWPGNVRELSNLVERLIVSDSKKQISHDSVMNILGYKALFNDKILSSSTLKDAVENLEKQMIESALKKYGSTYKTATALGTSQPTLYRKAKAYGIFIDDK